MTSLGRRLAVLLVVAGLATVGPSASIGPSPAAAAPVATASKSCSAYAEEHFHDVTANTPDGVKCLGSGEYCSHRPGYARAYREAGFRCKADGRLTEI